MNHPATQAPPTPVPHHAIDAIIFDLGGVLVDWNPRYLYRQIFTSADEMAYFLTEICSPAWNEEQDRGRSWDEAVRKLQAQYPQYWNEIAAYHLRWAETLRGELPETVKLLEQLRQTPLRLLALTNWSQQTFPIARERFGFLQWFEGILVSGEEGMAKPDQAIFELMASRYHLTPALTIFIDDSEKNVRAAQEAGYQAIHFTGAEALRAELARFGVVLADG
ncbi:MAG: HAD family phosphatase [Lautropia sp.]|nr:HAD family phosphatase [Lautropia sp.]